MIVVVVFLLLFFIVIFIVESLFFIEPAPLFLPVTDTSTLSCQIPDIPLSSVTFNSTATNTSCLVTSDRGSFSRLVPIREPEIGMAFNMLVDSLIRSLNEVDILIRIVPFGAPLGRTPLGQLIV